MDAIAAALTGKPGTDPRGFPPRLLEGDTRRVPPHRQGSVPLACFALVAMAIFTVSSFAQPSPSLQIELLATQQIRLSWPVAFSDFVVEFVDDLAPGANWAELGVTPTTIGGLLVITRDPLNAHRFYRLHGLGGADPDNDGIPSDVELQLGLDPRKADTDGDGIPDGEEDFDGDGLTNRWEVAHGYNPKLVDSDSNGVPDRLEDPDNDGLVNLDEAKAGTDPAKADSDGDGWDDNGEVAEGTDPTSPTSQPKITVVTAEASFLNAVPETPPPGTTIVSVTAAASYLNALAEAPPAGTIATSISAPASYLNSVAESLPSGTTIVSVSAPASYVNAVAELVTGPVFGFSPVVSYKNQ
jgi:hypothetical protein